MKNEPQHGVVFKSHLLKWIYFFVIIYGISLFLFIRFKKNCWKSRKTASSINKLDLIPNLIDRVTRNFFETYSFYLKKYHWKKHLCKTYTLPTVQVLHIVGDTFATFITDINGIGLHIKPVCSKITVWTTKITLSNYKNIQNIGYVLCLFIYKNM